MSKGRKTLRTVVNLVLFGAVLFVGGTLVRHAFDRANVRADIEAVVQEAQGLYAAMDRYHDRHQIYPASYQFRALDLTTLDPLRASGYYRGYLTNKLREHKLDAYESPDDRGLNQEYWMEMTLARDPSIRFLIAKSDDAPLSGGIWCDGVYVFRDGKLEPF